MSNGINAVVVSGNLTRDPELKALPSGTSVLECGIAVSRGEKQADGTYADRADFFDFVIYGARADALAGIMRKGMAVSVSGRLKYEAWEKDGNKHSRVRIVADNIVLPPRTEPEYAPTPAPRPTQTAEQVADALGGTLEEIPF